MNLKTKLAASLLILGSVSVAQATVYDVRGVFSEPTAMMGDTIFEGSFDWTGGIATTQTGEMNSSMGFMFNSATNLDLSVSSDLVTHGGGIYTLSFFNDVNQNVLSKTAMGVADGHDSRDGAWGPGGDLGRAFFSFSFTDDGTSLTAYDFAGNLTADGVKNVSSNDGSVDVDKYGMQYGDCSPASMMMGGMVCMTGQGISDGTNINGNDQGSGSMGGFAESLTLEVSQVPVPAAAWLFGGALMSLFGANRRKKVLPA